MKRPLTGLAVPILVSALLLSSCEQFFSTNLFQKAGLGQQSTPSASSLATMSVSDLQDLADSPQFYDDLAGDSAKKTAVLDNLSGVFASSSDPGTLQAAAALYAQVELNTTDGQAVVNGVASAALTTDPSNLLTGADVISFLKASLPADVLNDSTGAKFDAAVTAMLAAKPAYDALGASIVANGNATTLSASAIGDAAQGALLTYTLAGITTTNSPAGTVGDLWILVNGGSGVAVTNYSSPSGDANLNAILTAANSPFTF